MDLRLMEYLVCALVPQRVYLQFDDTELSNTIPNREASMP